MAVTDSSLEQCVETLCSQGCERVSASIDALKAGQVFTEVSGLSNAERQQVLDELESIMAPYEGRNCGS